MPPGSTFYTFIRCLACRGILGGYADGTFKPGNNVTRGQLSKIVSNSAGFNEPHDTQTFEDIAPSNTFYIYIVLGAIVAGGTAIRAVRKTAEMEDELVEGDTGEVEAGTS